MQNIYKVYYGGQYMCSFFDRDGALDWVATLLAEGEGTFDDYEILDGSDFLGVTIPSLTMNSIRYCASRRFVVVPS